MAEIKTPAACELGNSQLPKLIDLTCCSWMQLSVFVVAILLLWGWVCVYNDWICTPLAGWLADGWNEKTCCMWTWEFKTSKTHGPDLLLLDATSGSVCMIAQCLNGWMTGWWLRTHGLHPPKHTQVVHLILHNSKLFSISIVANGLHFKLCVVAVCVCVCMMAEYPLAYWFPQHRECVATTNSGMWPKSKIAELILNSGR